MNTHSMTRSQKLFLVVTSTALLILQSIVYVDVKPAAAISLACEAYAPLAPTGSGTVRRVSNQSQLASALKAAQPGDTINLASGTYSRLHYRRSSGHASGTTSNPIVIQAEQGARPVINPGNKKNRSQAVRVQYRSNIQVRGLEITNSQFGMMAHSSNNIVFEHNHVHSLGDSGIIANADYKNLKNGSDGVVIRCNEIRHTGLDEPDGHAGEGIYIGNGSNQIDPTKNVLIERNHLHNLTSEAVDIKSAVTNVTVRNNYIHDVDCVGYTGAGIQCSAIQVGSFATNYPNANVLVDANYIANYKRSDGGSQFGMLIGHGGVTVRNNIFNNVGNRVITFQKNFSKWGWGNPNARTVSFYNNTIWGCSGNCVSDLSAGDANLVARNNLISGSMSGSNRKANSSDFVGPLSGTADSGEGPGSGFKLKSDSGAVNSGATISGFNYDIDGGPRPTGPGWDHGAYEFGAIGNPSAGEWAIPFGGGGNPDDRTNGSVSIGGTYLGGNGPPKLQHAPPPTISDNVTLNPQTGTLDINEVSFGCSEEGVDGSVNSSLLCELIRYTNFFSMGVVVVASIAIAASGIQYTLSRGQPAKTAQAVSRIVKVAMGLVAYVFGWAFLNWLIPGGAL